MSSDNPILNNPYEEPKFHYSTDSEGSLNYNDVCKGRRIFKPESQVIPARQTGQGELLEWNDEEGQYRDYLVNLCRVEVGKWRTEDYPGTTRVTRELLNFWFLNPDRHYTKKLFFAQRESVETAIWINEVAGSSNAGQHILDTLNQSRKLVSPEPDNQLPRIAFKMATGTGKTVVMACLILYHYFNRQEYKSDTRFADYFLIVAPGITIKDRLGVLFVDTVNKKPEEIEDYYFKQDLVPQNLKSRLDNLNARIVITNYHTFEPRTLQGNKRSPFDGKVNWEGKKNKTDNKENFSQLIKRTLGKFKADSRLLIINDEAHHCYFPKSKEKTTDNEESDENAKAAVWFTGLKEISKRFKVQSVYDLSATPYYLNGSGYTPYSLFPWVVSDFGLIEAIESGLVKIPFLPESDSTQEIETPKLRNLYEHVKEELPRRGQRRERRETAEEGNAKKENLPKLPAMVKAALDQFYNHYKEYYEGLRSSSEQRVNLFSSPPVFIVVCNNTSVSKEMYKYIAGYEYENENGEIQAYHGAIDMFSNYDMTTNKLLKKPPTLLIDSDALENSDQINDEFKKIFATEIEEFKKDYARLYGQGSAEKITDAEILREVVNTVGKQGKLGAHIRCVVSVSMLTEGWDANTVTHIMGLRAFGSQLLCEQVAGRALRRISYYLQGYDKEGMPTTDPKKTVIEKFPPEYAHIIGVPFKLFKGGTATGEPPHDLTLIKPVPDRQKEMEITFPNVVGYRIEYNEDEIKYDFNGIENYEIDGSKFPIETVMASPISPEEQRMQVRSVLEKRDHELIFLITKELIRQKFCDDDSNPKFQRFGQLKRIVEEWYNSKILLLNIDDERYKKLIYFEDPKKYIDHIARGINPHINTSEYIRPVLNYYNPFGSTKYVYGQTSKEVFETKKSHINYVVMDSGWEGIAAKTLEELDVVCYVKNQFLGFTIPYIREGKERLYFPDFIVRLKCNDGTEKNLIIEISGMSKEKEEKKWYVENRWLPAVNSMKDKFGYAGWDFIEIANDIRNIKNELKMKIIELTS